MQSFGLGRLGTGQTPRAHEVLALQSPMETHRWAGISSSPVVGVTPRKKNATDTLRDLIVIETQSGTPLAPPPPQPKVAAITVIALCCRCFFFFLLGFLLLWFDSDGIDILVGLFQRCWMDNASSNWGSITWLWDDLLSRGGGGWFSSVGIQSLERPDGYWLACRQRQLTWSTVKLTLTSLAPPLAPWKT